ncbi:hypothetical protein HAX54_029521 [Datura stramonium]|uniref:Uncharacterized protein n=1 Tax=Datura stramonium TaxID=4076 RepID=A0ABS8V6D2_DATST|nr:hypothetical protein [Datura stramonium]
MRVHDEEITFYVYKLLFTILSYKDLCMVTEVIQIKCGVEESETARSITVVLPKGQKEKLFKVPKKHEQLDEWSEHEPRYSKIEINCIRAKTDEPPGMKNKQKLNHRRRKRMGES